MDANQQQKILGYFIEEAKEHLETLEQGILDLSSLVEDPERVDDMFRAAHSIKGGGAMLGYSTIQKTAHRLEDALKVLKEQKISVDKKLETLFFNGYDALKDLIDELQSPFGLRDEKGQEIVANAQPNFVELQNHLNQLVGGEGKLVSLEQDTVTGVIPEIASQGREILKQMLQLLKGKSSSESRQKLQKLCDRLAKLNQDEENWVKLTQIAKKAIANPKHSYRTLAPVIIKDLKIGCDLLHCGRSSEIAASHSLQQLATTKLPQVLIPVEPKSAAKTLQNSFNKQQLAQLVQLLAAKG
ncbi:Hpt domain-containing protein [Oscillatoria salina]|uniref:Hpt domain-containing protein n=1 Tax=Oscillatoria salina TaxID=331517 RepID=UPI0013BA298B|nr:Hpt domain-containing protein [Oscillatoria salina]MBZ8183169.1 histidine kinase [Oscillatoria salina IIICB1]NET90658.1 histidine kinase [Kamptonema sp. SIO1D9]